jgi:hypothetical protein
VNEIGVDRDDDAVMAVGVSLGIFSVDLGKPSQCWKSEQAAERAMS